MDDAEEIIRTPIEQMWARIEQMATDLIVQLPNVILGIIVVILAWFIGKLVRSIVIRTVRRSKISNQVGLAFGRIAHYLVFIIGIFLALVSIFPSLDMSNAVSALGISGVAIGFAFRDILQNFFAGLLLLISEPFTIGDQIIYDDYEGTVQRIETRATTIRTYDGRIVVVPNAELFTNPVTVNTANTLRRFDVVVGVDYDTDISFARDTIMKLLATVEDIVDAPAPSVLVTELGDSSINLRIRWWTHSLHQDGISTRDEVFDKIIERFREQDISIPFPTREIIFNTPLSVNNQTE